jgi:signal transduction histidine kinase
MWLKNRTLHLPLFWKFAIISIIGVVVFGFINVYLLWTSVYKTFDKEIDKRVKVLAKIVADKALNPMVYGNNLELNNILDNIKQSDSSIVYIFIINNTNDIVAQTYDISIPIGLLDANSLKSGKYKIRVINTKHFKYQTIRDIAYPILNGEVGTVRLGIAESHIHEQMNEATTNMVVMIVAFFVIGLGGAFVFSYIITTPIKKISQKAQVIDLNYIETNDDKITLPVKLNLFNIKVNDEMDILVMKFSEMLERLRISYSELKETQNALVQAEKLASLGTLAAGVAHEINNPISGIKNCANRIIKKPGDTAQNEKYMLLIKEATDKIESVVQHLLNYSRKQNFEFEKVDLNAVINNAISLTEYKLQRSNLNVKADFDDKYFVKGSANHLEQIIVNLILNSLDAILDRKEKEPDFEGQIEVNLNRRSGKVYIHLIDNGIGIPIEIQDKIYDPFFTSKKVGKGTGLGLAVSYNLIKEHGGKVYFNTSEGVGTEFVLELPCYSR